MKITKENILNLCCFKSRWDQDGQPEIFINNNKTIDFLTTVVLVKIEMENKKNSIFLEI